MGQIGVPELIILIVFSGVGLLPLAAGAWAVIVLNRVQNGQKALEAKLDNIERLLHRAG
jgi:hypothetical protein